MRTEVSIIDTEEKRGNLKVYKVVIAKRVYEIYAPEDLLAELKGGEKK